ncbi:MAG TPA: hypothetical protein VJT73_15515 [Polyangiaceae bacterium]|nr:hypothetical protein [Polyangiaceae bacterium]
MKARYGSATVALGAFAAISVLAAGASAQAAPDATPAPTGPTMNPTTTPQYPLGEQKTELFRPNPVLLTTGGITLLGAYVPGFVVAVGSDHDGDKWLYAPVIGPWIDLASRGCDDGQIVNCGTNAFDRAALIGSGVVQALGLVQLAASFTMPQRRLVTTQAADKPTFHLAPSAVGSRGQGIVAFGTF